MRHVVIAVLILFTGTLVTSRASECQVPGATSAPAGVRVRVTLDNAAVARQVGRILLSTSDSLILIDTVASPNAHAAAGVTRSALAWSTVRSIEESQGAARGKWAWIGAAIGGIGGGVVGYLGTSRDVKRAEPGLVGELVAPTAGAVGAIAIGAVSAGAGALLGAVLAPERWRLVSRTR